MLTIRDGNDLPLQTNQMKQKIMVNGVSYELQSIFGMDQNDKKNREVCIQSYPLPPQSALPRA